MKDPISVREDAQCLPLATLTQMGFFFYLKELSFLNLVQVRLFQGPEIAKHLEVKRAVKQCVNILISFQQNEGQGPEITAEI